MRGVRAGGGPGGPRRLSATRTSAGATRPTSATVSRGRGPTVSVALVLAGGVTAVAGHRRYRRNEQAIAADQPLPVSTAAAWVTGLVALLAVALLVLVAVEIGRR